MSLSKSTKNQLCRLLAFIPDKAYLHIAYFAHTKNRLHLSDPQTFNEKLQWLKINDKNPIYCKIVDKYTVREYIKQKIGSEYLIPLLGVWDSANDIPFDQLPEKFVLKCTHDSGSVIVCTSKGDIDQKAVKQKLNKALKQNIFYNGREWPYKNVKPRIIAEEFLTEASGMEPKDYKIFCFNGMPRFIQVDQGRFHTHRRNMYTPEWQPMDMEIRVPRNREREVDKPENLKEMLEFAKVLSKDFPFVRVDFYSVNNRLYFGELTLYPGNGYGKITPDEWNHTLGEWIRLPDNKKQKANPTI